MLNDHLRQKIINAMEAAAPNEMCGFLLNIDGKQRWREVKNVSINPVEHFRIDPVEFAQAQDDGQILAVVHSHPNGPGHFSEADKLGCESSKLPWILVVPGEEQFQVLRPSGYSLPVEGRQWCHGSVDCYSTVRDYYSREHGLELPDFERNDDWWDKGQNLYLDHVHSVGFHKVQGEPRPGDAILFSIRSNTPNHAAIYLGDNVMLHHYTNQLSRKTVIGGWWLDRLHGFYRHQSME